MITQTSNSSFLFLITLLIFCQLGFTWAHAQRATDESQEFSWRDLEEIENLADNANHIAAEWAHSPVHTTYLTKEEAKLYKLMKNYRQSLKERIDMLEKYTTDYVEATNLGDKNGIVDEMERAKIISGHPLMTYRMIRRFAYDLTQIKEHVETQAHHQLAIKTHVETMNKTFLLPNQTDVNNVMRNILRLQQVYDFKAKDLLHGIIGDKNTGIGFTVAQAFELGEFAFAQKSYVEALDWFQNVLLELKVDPHLEDVNINDVLDSIRNLIQEHDDLQDSITSANFYDVTLNRFSGKINSTEPLTPLKSIIKNYQPFDFMKTCSGILTKTPAESSNLYCHLESKIHPFWIINPLKIEIHSLDPLVYQIYEAINEEIIYYLKNSSSPILERSTVMLQLDDSNMDPNPYQLSERRTGSYTFLRENEHEVLMEFEKKIGVTTGLVVENRRWDGKYVEMEASEAIQVAAYGYGCHFSEHTDALHYKENETRSGDRIATAMYYLNDVEMGGLTAFPILKIAVRPVKGSVLVWYNLYKNGTPDQRTLHGGCPVIMGQKWIANKWIRYNVNFKTRPCSLNPEE